MNQQAPPLIVDIDGTLLCGDLLIEGVARMLGTAPLKLFALPVWLCGGRAPLKRKVAEACPLAPDTLVRNPAVCDAIATAQEQRREVWLASAAHSKAVAPLAETLGVTGFLASAGRTNLAGRAKAKALLARFGAQGFDYIGNERRDLAVWRHARRAIGVGLAPRLQRRLLRLDKQAHFLPSGRGGLREYVRVLRPHQWVKNILVFAPLVAAHQTRLDLYLAGVGIWLALTELHLLKESAGNALSGRAYLAEDHTVLAALNAAANSAAVVMLMLYIHSLGLDGRYTNPQLLWLMCPLLLYCLGRLSLLANRGKVHDDPILFALRDKLSWFCAALCLAAFGATL